MKSKEDNTQKKSKKLSSKELSWVLYDVGNSAYTLLACALIPIWYKSLAVGDGAGQISSDRATAYYAVAIAVMTVVSALILPILHCPNNLFELIFLRINCFKLIRRLRKAHKILRLPL
jgi:MFS transporter, UMF1 family